ncbi:Cell cycle serine/threonine-protein kinase cdc5/MSD2 [Fusarium falciforme]|nr:Cell cycle serine/threonine-protein kinase cdc5/MSD2 [Fusarium falciforme]
MAHRLAPRGGIDLEALSPRDANAQRVPKTTEIKTKTVAQLRAAKDKEHPPPPPAEVIEPPAQTTPTA